eukprot:gnl/Carplike_NY0171/1911_a2587_1045.p1 GENE.gnl/Carplike_NY0171/1911_a2587_1045~~gnl/Carplike_NY0171/1911_a2587_1045.p1  ORF type:complete len:317 (-),score=90.72 gnl/Carplike_NY0171/1911_a2587_1045:97-1047(-)
MVMKLGLHPELKDMLMEYRKERSFNAKEWIDKKVEATNEYFALHGLSGACINVSGGIDSAVTLALLKKASMVPGSPLKKVLGIAQPIHSTATIQDRAYVAGKAAGVEIITVDQSSLEDRLSSIVIGELKGDLLPKPDKVRFARGQLRSYMRTPVLYFVAQMISAQGFPCVCVGTGNFDEDGYLRYFCKAGDGVADIQLIADLHKSEVFAVARALEGTVPDSIIEAKPSADLWEGQSDEDELGVSYDFVELYTGYMMKGSRITGFEERIGELSEEARAEFLRKAKLVEYHHKRNAHKAHFPLNINVLPLPASEVEHK